jgi:two-component system, NarL family, response regulator DegU
MKDMEKIRLMIIEDNRLLREGIRMMLKVQDDIIVVAALGDKIKVSDKINELKPHVLLLDLGLVNRNSLKLVGSTSKEFPGLKIIVMCLLPVQAEIKQFIMAGVSGFILKDAPTKDFLKTIRSVAKGEKVFPLQAEGSLLSEIVNSAASEAKLDKSLRMTEDEKKVLKLISLGLNDTDISKQLGFTHTVVKNLEDNILEKMSLSTRVQAGSHREQKDTESKSKIIKK